MMPMFEPAFAGRLSDWVQVIKAEFGGVPDLQLTVTEAGQIWPLEPPRLEAVLDAFVSAKYLQRSSNGVYALHSDQQSLLHQ